MSAPDWFSLGEVSAFVNLETRLLNRNDLAAWSALFDDDGYYFMPLHESMDDPERFDALVYDNRTLMAIRVEHGRLGGPVIDEQRVEAVRQVSDIHLVDAAEETCRVGATFMACIQWREKTWYAGRHVYALRRRGDGYRICYKRVYLIGADRTLGPIMAYL